MSITPSERVRLAIRETRRLMTGEHEGFLDHLITSQAMWRQNGKHYIGAAYAMTPEAVNARISNAGWDPYDPSPLQGMRLGKNCSAFRSSIAGRKCLASTFEMDDERIMLCEGRNNTMYGIALGGFSDYTQYSTIVLGPYRGSEVVYTLHPGDPEYLSMVPVIDDFEAGLVIKSSEALHLGLINVIRR